jgi:hypothetical protein
MWNVIQYAGVELLQPSREGVVSQHLLTKLPNASLIGLDKSLAAKSFTVKYQPNSYQGSSNIFWGTPRHLPHFGELELCDSSQCTLLTRCSRCFNALL